MEGWAPLERVDRRWLLRIVVAGLGAFLVGYLVMAVFFFPKSNRPPVVTVPDLRELDRAMAEQALRGLDLEIGPSDSLPNPEIPSGRVLSQSPLPGEEVPPGTPVRMILSAGAPRRAIPVVRGMSRDQATAILAASGFDLTVTEIQDPSPAGRVVETRPGPGTELRLPASVRIVVSSGPPLVEVPDLTGLSEEDVAGALAAAGLELGDVDYRFSGFSAAERVIGQEPAAGDSITRGSAVRVRISTPRLPGRRIRD
jgi:serine/threonine-protein kinase